MYGCASYSFLVIHVEDIVGKIGEQRCQSIQFTEKVSKRLY